MLAFVEVLALCNRPDGENQAQKLTMKTSSLLSSVVSALAAASATGQVLWINELHYDNIGADAGEFVEIVAEDGLDLSLGLLELYNGAGGTVYDSATLDSFAAGASGNGFTVYSLAISPIQNGSPDGLALSYDGTLVQFLSYEGTFTGVGGAAAGVLSTDIGVDESGEEAAGSSLGLVGTGSAYSDFTWSALADDSPGAFNTGQTVVPEPHEYAAFAGLGLLGFAAWRRGRRA